MGMTLQQLRYFSALAKNLHYTKTAVELHISQPSLSYSIAELEKEFGVSFFDKKDGKIYLTRHGELFLPFAEKALATLDEGTQKIKVEICPHEGTVNLGYFYSISSTFIPSLIDNFYKINEDNNIKFNLVQDLNKNLVNGLRAGTIDLAFCVKKADGISSLPVIEQELFLIVSSKHKFAAKKQISITEFAEEPLIMLNKNSGLRGLTETIFSERGYSPVVAFEAAECNAVMQFVSLGRGIAIIPKVPAMSPSAIKVIKITEPEFRRTVYASWINDKILPPAKKVLDYIKNTVGGNVYV